MSDSRTTNSLKNMAASVTYQLLNLVLSFVSRTVFLQVLGVGYLGISGLFGDVLSMLNMAELGFGTAMTFSMYKPLAENDQETLAGLTQFYKKVYRIIALAIAGIGVALIPFLPYLVNLEQELEHLELYYVLFLASHVASYLVVYKTTVLYADQKNHILLKYSSYWSMAQTIVMLLVLWLTHNYILYLVTQVVFVYAQNFHKSYIAQKHYPFLNKKVTLPKEKTNGIFKDVGSAFLYKIANVLITATDNTLISVLVSTEMVGYYSNYNIIVGRLSNIAGTLFYSLVASLGNLIAKESHKRRYQVFQAMQSISSILSVFCSACIFLLEEDFIRIWLGPEYILSKLTLIAIVLNFFFKIAISPVTSFREAAGLFRKTKFIMLWTAVLNIVFSIILGKLIGLAGILFATSISRVLTFYWYEPLLLYRDFFNQPCRQYFAELLKSIGVMCTAIAGAYLASCWLTPTNWLELILKGIIVVCISMVVTIIFYRKSEGAAMILERTKGILGKFQKSRLPKD